MTPDLLVAVRTLQEFIKANLPEVEDRVFDEWPNAKVELEVPCITIITTGTPTFTHSFPNIFKRSADPENPINDVVAYSVGYYDMNIQLDLWCEYKLQRAELFDKLMAVLNKQFIDTGAPTGLSLELIDYHEAIARYDQNGYTFMDGEDGSQRAEWRVKVDVTVNHFKLIEKSEPRMVEITLKSEVKTDENDYEVEENFEV
jgi:hypothetical protein